jgi:beta-galactosidase GanA
MKLGTAYYPDYFPAAEWARDLDRMKAAGIGCVRILEFAWSWYQPEPGRWSWDGLDQFLDLAGERNLAVCLSTAAVVFREAYRCTLDERPGPHLLGASSHDLLESSRRVG